MSVRIIIYAYRKPGTSPEHFKTSYEAHISLVKRIAGDDFPLSHQRHYLARTVDTSAEGVSVRNTTTPATLIAGDQSDFDFDAYAELTFADQPALQAFVAKVRAPEAAEEIAADEEGFLDRSKLGIAFLDDVVETRK
ncbi:hypothetical protein N7492_005822 [Penicillium capsulatum]|uniref:EthD domain-containing protein n=1 Tax=Penicillium capsulatum TaxID=69766 RepID=A0A9W9LRD3_9EURO|nr:hypothetical protein N7492_005822 [Penicillium capsulatum]KAJ6135078.1 hypothetical protein N7512_000238 [Penicillium capsulatum]